MCSARSLLRGSNGADVVVEVCSFRMSSRNCHYNTRIKILHAGGEILEENGKVGINGIVCDCMGFGGLKVALCSHCGRMEKRHS